VSTVDQRKTEKQPPTNHDPLPHWWQTELGYDQVANPVADGLSYFMILSNLLQFLMLPSVSI
jgi:hypothetical protein